MRELRLPLCCAVVLTACVSVDPSSEPPPPANQANQANRARARRAASVDLPRPSAPAWDEIGRSAQDRPIRARQVGHGPRRVLWIGGIHGNEREGSHATEELAWAFLDSSALPDRVTLTIVDDINPDGSAANRRGNAEGVDLNRDFPAKNRRPGSKAPSQPESALLCDLILELEPDTVIVAHSWGAKPTGPKQFVNFDGPAEDLARTFAAISPSYPMRDSRHLPATPGSLGSWVGVDMQIPILTLEFMRGKDPIEAWRETREAILAVIRG